MRAPALLLILCLTVGGCAAPPDTVPITPKSEVSTAPVVRLPLPDTPTPPPAAPVPGAPPSGPALAMAPIVVPTGFQYVCVVDRAGTREQTTIQFVAKVADLCRRHPEMGPCQYERNMCRSSGGRVFTANGTEITMLTEAEYDKKVMRVRFKAN